MLLVYTESGSIYEVDRANGCVRRKGGMNGPTPRMGTDGEWKKYAHASDIVVGVGVLFTWRFEMDDIGAGFGIVGRATLTSHVTKIVDLAAEGATSTAS